MPEEHRLERQTLTVKEVADLLGFSTNSIYKFLSEGRIKGERLGRGRFRISRAEIERFLGPAQAHSAPPEAAAGVPPAAPTFPHQEERAVPHISEERTGLSWVHLGGFPDMFDWYLGFMLFLESIGFLLRSSAQEPVFGSPWGAYALAALFGFSALAFLWANALPVQKKLVHRVTHVGVLLSVLVLAAHYVSQADLHGIVESFSLLFVLLFSWFLVHITPGKRFVLLLCSLGFLSGLSIFLRPGLIPGSVGATFLTMYRSWVFTGWVLFLGVFLFLIRWSKDRGPGVHTALFWLFGIVPLVVAVMHTLNGAWDHVAFAISVAGFCFLFPFRGRFSGLPLGHRAAVTISFLWLAVLLAVFLFLARFLQAQLERSYFQSAEAHAVRAERVIAEHFGRAEGLVDAQVTNELLVEAVAREDVQRIGLYAKTLYDSSVGSIDRVFLFGADGIERARYPRGNVSAEEIATVEEAVARVLRTPAGRDPERILQSVGDRPGARVFARLLLPPTGDATAVGASVVLTNAERLQERLRAVTFLERGAVAVADDGKRYVYHPNPAYIGKPVEKNTELLRALGGEIGRGRGTRDGDRSTALKVTRTLPDLGWAIAAEYPLTGAFTFGSMVIILIFSIVLLLSVASFWVVLRILHVRQHVVIPPVHSP